jgi:C-terminal processing protease CtpA/Prc
MRIVALACVAGCASEPAPRARPGAAPSSLTAPATTATTATTASPGTTTTGPATKTTAPAVTAAHATTTPRATTEPTPLDPDRVPFAADDRAAELAFLRDAIRDTYAHLDVKRTQWGVDLDEMFARYEPRIRAADTWAKYESVMVRFVSRLHDGHVDYRRKRGTTETKRMIVRLGLSTRFVGSMLIVDEVWPGSSAERAGLKVGDHIVAIDEHTVDGRMKLLADLRSWSRLEAAQYDFAREWPASRIPANATPQERKLTRRLADGTEEVLRVTPETTPRPGGRPESIEVVMHGDVAVLHVRELGMKKKELAVVLDEVIAKVFDTATGLVVDLRANDGGFEDNAREIAARLVAHPVTGGEARVKLSERSRAAYAAWKDLAEDPKRPGWSVVQPLRADGKARVDYGGKIAVLVDAGCRSSCEALALLMRAASARLYGDRTGGASGAPVTIELPSSHAKVRIPARAMYDMRGTPIEGYGVDPDVHVAANRDDIVAGRDPVLAAAITHVRSRRGRRL